MRGDAAARVERPGGAPRQGTAEKAQSATESWARLGDYNFFHLDDVRMPERLENFNLADGGDREPLSVSIFLHFDPLQRHNLLSVPVTRHENLRIDGGGGRQEYISYS